MSTWMNPLLAVTDTPPLIIDTDECAAVPQLNRYPEQATHNQPGQQVKLLVTRKIIHKSYCV